MGIDDYDFGYHPSKIDEPLKHHREHQVNPNPSVILAAKMKKSAGRRPSP